LTSLGMIAVVALALAAFPAHSIGAPKAANAAKSGGTQKAVSPSANFKTLYTFTGGADGAGPNGPLLRDKQGNLYGVTSSGGDAPSCTFNYGCGVVFMLDPSGKETVLYAFTGGTDGAFPIGDLIMDSRGNLFGATMSGGIASCYYNECGVIFELSPPATKGIPWAETVLHAFTGGDDGFEPYAGLTADGKGNAYGTTAGGGLYQGGVVFMMDASGNETVLYNFCSEINTFGNCDDGESPSAAPILDAQGNVYGTTSQGGPTDHDFGQGMVYKLTPDGKETVLYSFCSVGDCADGAHPTASLVEDALGNFYSTTSGGGNLGHCVNEGCGLVFELTPDGHGTGLHRFSGDSDGAIPSGGTLSQDSQGDLYGTTVVGGNGSCTLNGAQGCGTVFRVTPDRRETVLYRFTGQTDGAFPTYGLTSGRKGHAYGTTSGGEDFPNGYGTVFEISQ
jgi:uncharacterized repeat protein (TIGR03803 family)